MNIQSDLGFSPDVQKFLYLSDLSPYKNAVMQSFHIDNKTDLKYMTQAYDEGYRLSRHMPNGQEIDFMLCKGGGHGTHNGYRWIGNKLWIYSHYTNAAGKAVVVRFQYKAGVTLNYGTNGMEDVYTAQINNPYTVPVINENEQLMLYRIEGRNDKNELINYCEIRDLADIDNKINKLLYKVDIPQYLTTNENPMQGVTFANGVVYWYTGNYNLSTPNYLTAFDMKSNKQIWQRKISIGGTAGIVDGNSAEGEGMQFYYDNVSGSYGLIIGVTVGAANNRSHKLYGVFQAGLFEILKADAVPLSLADTGGRRKALPIVTTKLSEIKSPGSYYLTTDFSKTVVDFPYPKNWINSGWSFDVGYANMAGDVKQTLTRNTFSKSLFSFTRMISSTTIGPWNYEQSYSLKTGEQVHSSVKKLTDLNIPGMTWYMTTEDSKRMVDFPRNDGVSGWTISNSMADTGGGFTQKVSRNSVTSASQIYVRTVSNNTGHKWSIYEGKLV